MPEDNSLHKVAGAANGADEKAHEGPNPSDIAYPPRLKAEERKLIDGRPKWANRGDDKKEVTEVGIALSGGGIRSATFCLGVFQAMAKRKLLGQIDYISSVSGGSYFAAFYGRLFSRPDLADSGDPSSALVEIEKILSPNEKCRLDFPEEVAWKRGIFGWLRENGRYLAPKGGGDLLIGVAVMLRNWLTVQLIMAAVVLALMVLAQLLRLIGAKGLLKIRGWVMPPLSSGAFWWSPYVIVAIAMWLLWVMPSGWAYWMLPQGVKSDKEPPSKSWIWPVLASLCVSVAAAIAATQVGRPACYILAGIAVGFVPASVLCLWAQRLPAEEGDAGSGSAADVQSPAQGSQNGEVADYKSELARNRISAMTRTALIATAAILAFALIDSFGQTLYADRFSDGHHILKWIGGAYGIIAVAAPFAQWAASALMPKTKGRHVTIPMSLLAGVAAAAVIVLVLIALDGLSHAIAYDFERPADAPPALMTTSELRTYEVSLKLCHGALGCCDSEGGCVAQGLTSEEQCTASLKLGDMSLKCEKPGTKAMVNRGSRHRSCKPLSIGLTLLGLFSFFVGYERNKNKSSKQRGTSAAWMFLNRTSLHAIYTSRLIRAYLGASNRLRYGKDAAGGVSDVMNGDDISQERYWIDPDNVERERFYKRGGPLHIVNSTLNETLSGQSKVEQRDRHGMGLAVGPVGMTAGVRHHAVYVRSLDRDKTKVEVYPQAPNDFRIFDYDPADSADWQNLANHPEVIREFKGEQLSLGNWTGVSGAAAATGMGYRTSLGLSLLFGFFNVRLGYWWDSGVPERDDREKENAQMEQGKKNAGTEKKKATGTGKSRRSRRIGQKINKWFPVQTYLLDEFLGRFHGPARRRWYLSDGGNFENLGGYELIRRRLPLIVVIDAGADPDYGFEDMANLVRKARLDFNAEITFLEGDALKDECKRRCMPAEIQKFYGGLDELRRGKWVDEPRPGDPKSQISFESGDILRYSLKYVALARIHYLDQAREKDSYMIVIKPTLIGEEPTDILQYHQQRPSFPHEGTANQFFDEAQWESYRRLGEHIGESIFREPGAGGFLAPCEIPFC